MTQKKFNTDSGDYHVALNVFLSILFIPYVFCIDHSKDQSFEAVQKSIIGSCTLHTFSSLPPDHALTQLIDQQTLKIEKGLLNSTDVLESAHFIPPLLQNILQRCNTREFPCITSQNLSSAYKLFTLLLLVDQRISPTPIERPYAQKLLIRALKAVYNIRWQTSLEVKFRLAETPESSLIDTVIAASMGALVITLPRNLMNLQAWNNHGQCVRPAELLEKTTDRLEKTLSLEKMGSAIRAFPKQPLLAVFSPITKCFGYKAKVAPFERNTNEPFLQTYSTFLLEYLKQTKPSPLLDPPNSPMEDTLWKIAMIYTFLQGDVPIFPTYQDTSESNFSLDNVTPLLHASPTIRERIIQTAKNALQFCAYSTPHPLFPPVLEAATLHQNFQAIWQQEGPQFNPRSTYSAEVGLWTMQDLACLGEEDNVTDPRDLKTCCALVPSPVLDLKIISGGILFLFPSVDALWNISSLMDYIQFAASCKAMAHAMELYKKGSPSVDAEFRKERDQHVLEQYDKLNRGHTRDSEHLSCYNKFLKRHINKGDEYLAAISEFLGSLWYRSPKPPLV